MCDVLLSERASCAPPCGNCAEMYDLMSYIIRNCKKKKKKNVCPLTSFAPATVRRCFFFGFWFGFLLFVLVFFFLWSSGFHAVKVSKPCRVLLKYARQDAEAYRLQYNEVIPVAQLVRKVAAVMQEFTRALSLV